MNSTKTIREVVVFLLALSLVLRVEATPQEEIKSITQEYQTAVTELNTAARAAKTPEEREKLIKEKRPDVSKYASRVWAIVEKNEKDSEVLPGLIWLTSSAYQTEEAGKALGILAKQYANHELAGSVVGMAPHIASPHSKEFLKAVQE